MKRIFAVMAVAILMGFGASFAQSAGTFKDSHDGKTYRTVKVGTAVWMAENLNFAAKGSVCYENKDANCVKYGRLYDWDTALKACPAGYHLPSDDEWTALVNYAGGEEKAGKMLKSSKGWKSAVGINYYGFSALPGGYGYADGSFYNAGNNGDWWSATGDDANGAWIRGMYYNDGSVGRGNGSKSSLFSVRCVKD